MPTRTKRHLAIVRNEPDEPFDCSELGLYDEPFPGPMREEVVRQIFRDQLANDLLEAPDDWIFPLTQFVEHTSIQYEAGEYFIVVLNPDDGGDPDGDSWRYTHRTDRVFSLIQGGLAS